MPKPKNMRFSFFTLKVLLMFFIFHGVPITFDATAQSITWQRTYGGNLDFDEGYSIVQTPDSGYIAVGRKRMNSIEHMYSFRLNKFGDLIWEKIFPYDHAWKIEPTDDNNFIIMGRFTNLIKININGDTLWKSGPYSYSKTFTSIKQTIDGGYVICGANEIGFRNYPYLFKISSSGDSLWERTYINNIFEGRFTDLVISNDNNFVMSANISDSSFISDKLSIIKTDTSGNIIWFHRYDSLEYYITKSIVQSNDGSYVIGGGSSSFISKFSPNGNLLWIKQYDTFLNSNCLSVSNTFDGNFTFAGWWDSNASSNFYVRLRKVDNNGNEIWRKSFGFSGNEYAVGLKQTYDSGYAIIGLTTYGNMQREDAYIIKTDKFGNANPYIGIEPTTNTVPVHYEFNPIYPNPFNPEATLKFSIPFESKVNLAIYDILGREICVLVNEKLKVGSYKIKWEAFNLTSGLYFAKLFANSFENNFSFSKTQKIVLIK